VAAQTLLSLLLLVLLGACEPDPSSSSPPPPRVLTRDAVGYFCSMIVEDHEGPKGQAVLEGARKTLWFTSARDTLAFMLLPEEPKSGAAVYVTDMGNAAWEHPENSGDVWIDARTAWYVVGSRKVGGMGQPEAVPFAARAAAEAFAVEFGGEVVDYPSLPTDYILGSS
jgi:copper chaperone NosL